jgi:putative restriction endonuclease
VNSCNSFAIYERHNGEIAVAFRPEFIVDYALHSAVLHETGELGLPLLNNLAALTEDKIDSAEGLERTTIFVQMAKKYRAQDFRRRVLAAYEHRCAMCALQLELIDAAHILPVAAPKSTDETSNGIALCKLHHAAFDRNLIVLDESYKIAINDKAVQRLVDLDKVGGLKGFKQNLKTVIVLPADRRDYPNKEYIRAANAVKNSAG